MVRRLILIRHGESEANRANLFTGRLDPPLTRDGRAQAEAAGRRLRGLGVHVDEAFASPRLRTVTSCAIVLCALDQRTLRIRACAGLSERDYGALDGVDKSLAEARWGRESVQRWRRSYAEAPPGGESLRDASVRVLLCYLADVLPAAMRGTALVVAHGNSLRALVMALDDLAPDEVEALELPTGSMRLYHLAADGTVLSRAALDEGGGAGADRPT